jgi:hypothetical protein
MNKITAEHLARRACVYIRQSTPDQVKYNLESKGRQYAWHGRGVAQSPSIVTRPIHNLLNSALFLVR